jgi:ATP-dependent RNA helicase DDX55/SPB4
MYDPLHRRTGLFSATMTSGVKELARAGLRNPGIKNKIYRMHIVFIFQLILLQIYKASISVKVKNADGGDVQRVPSTLQNNYVVLDSKEKLVHLLAFIKKHEKEKVIIFFMTCAEVEYFGRALQCLKELKEISISTLHGRMVAKRRTGTYDSFVKSERGVY